MADKRIKNEDTRDVFDKVFGDENYDAARAMAVAIPAQIAGAYLGRRMTSRKQRAMEQAIFKREQEAMGRGPALSAEERKILDRAARAAVSREAAGMFAGSGVGIMSGIRPKDKRKQ